VTGAVSSWTRKPAIDGPAMNETERLRLSLLFASTKSRRGTTLTMSVDQLMSNMTVNVPTAKPTTSSC
jgi:hypothetical protein